jgi:hypothetical protein
VVCSSSCKCVDCLNFEGDALMAAKCRVPDRDRSKPSPKPLKRRPSHVLTSSKVVTWDSVWRSAHATPSDASMQLLGCLLRSGSFESKMFGDDFFEAIQQAPAVTDAFALDGVEGIEALLCFLNPMLDFVVERAVLEAAAAAASSGGGGSGISVKDEANGHVKNEEDSEHAESELGDDDAADDDEHEEDASVQTDGDDNMDNSNDGDRMHNLGEEQGDLGDEQGDQHDGYVSNIDDARACSAGWQGGVAGAGAHELNCIDPSEKAAAVISVEDDGMDGL